MSTRTESAQRHNTKMDTGKSVLCPDRLTKKSRHPKELWHLWLGGSIDQNIVPHTKSFAFSSLSGHIPMLRVHSLVGARTESNQLMFLSHTCFSLFLFLIYIQIRTHIYMCIYILQYIIYIYIYYWGKNFKKLLAKSKP